MTNENYMLHLMQKLGEAVQLKSLVAALLVVVGFMFDPTQHIALVALFVLMMADTVFGVAAARKCGEAIRSAKLRRTAIKVVIYYALIACAHITEFALPSYMHFLDESVLGFLAATELLSILENVGKLGYVVPRQLVKLLGDYTNKQ